MWLSTHGHRRRSVNTLSIMCLDLTSISAARLKNKTEFNIPNSYYCHWECLRQNSAHVVHTIGWSRLILRRFIDETCCRQQIAWTKVSVTLKDAVSMNEPMRQILFTSRWADWVNHALWEESCVCDQSSTSSACVLWLLSRASSRLVIIKCEYRSRLHRPLSAVAASKPPRIFAHLTKLESTWILLS